MVINRLHVGRKNRLIMIVYVNGGIGPEMEALRERRGIEEADIDFEQSLVREERQAERAFEVPHRFDFAEPKGAAAVRIFGDRVIGRAVGAGPMVLRPIELDAAGQPRSRQTDQGRFDDVVVVDERVTVGLVVCVLNPPAKTGHAHQLEILILQEPNPMLFLDFLVTDSVDDGVRIDASRATLIDALFQKHRVAIRLADEISGDDCIPSPNPNSRLLAHGYREAGRSVQGPTWTWMRQTFWLCGGTKPQRFAWPAATASESGAPLAGSRARW